MINLKSIYSAKSFPGVAIYIDRFSSEDSYEGDLLICEEESCDHNLSEMCWIEGGYSTVVNYNKVIGVMVGDDEEHIIPVEDLTELIREVCTCGQLGCDVYR
jgi:hypothetical protein